MRSPPSSPVAPAPGPAFPAAAAPAATPPGAPSPATLPPALAHRQSIRDFAVEHSDSLDASRQRNAYFHRYLARIVSHHVLPNSRILDIGCAAGDMLDALHPAPAAGVGIDINPAALAHARQRFPAHTFLELPVEDITPAALAPHMAAGPDSRPGFDYIILSGVLPQLYDLHTAMAALHTVCHDRTRLIIATFSRLWHPLIRCGETIGWKARVTDESWIPPLEVRNLLSQCNFAIIRQINSILCPVGIPLLSNFINRWITPLPFINQLSLCTLTIARPLPGALPSAAAPAESRAASGVSAFSLQHSTFPSVSIIVPARNEAGNIRPLLDRLPRLADRQEVIFVEGHSTDDTWQVIQQALAERSTPSPLSASVPQSLSASPPGASLSALQQPGKGKGDAVRAAFARATGDILLILDADLSVPPEELPRFVDLVARGHVEFANGSRLVYPMERQAMQFLNLLANKTFGWTFTYLLGQHLRDTLCGTKVLRRSDYLRIAAHRAYFGDFDPFGDFDLLFGAARLNLKIQDVPVHYKQRTYGTTNISRFRHGLMLLRMCSVAARKLKFV